LCFLLAAPTRRPKNAPWTGFLGTNLFVGQITDPATGVLTSFVVLARAIRLDEPDLQQIADYAAFERVREEAKAWLPMRLLV